MLKRLTVSNLAVVERAEANFVSGLNVLTGETGAGKSVLLGALELVLGGRADASVVRDGAKEAEVEADFGDVVVRRTVTVQGRSRAWIDDESVSVAELKELGNRLVDIHGPTANQNLVNENFQREALDAFGDIRGSKAEEKYGKAFEESERLRLAEEKLASGGGEDEAEMLRYQVDELEGAALCADDETIAERHAAAAHAGEIIENANAITEMLGGDGSVAELLIRSQPRFRELAKHLPAATEWSEAAEEITVKVQELSRTVADAVSRLDVGDEDLDELDRRLTLVNRLRRKYLRNDTGERTPVAALLETLAVKKEKLDAIEHRDERLAEIRGELAVARKRVEAAGAELTKLRLRAASQLSKAITKELRDLGFIRARFYVDIERIEPDRHGMDRVVYMFEPNPGEPARPLRDIASSGEIARVMLAMKVVVSSGRDSAGANSPVTLVFDEIDANIGGEIGKVVGEKLRKVSDRNQVIAITHLPQSAVYGERHLVVSKAVVGGRTQTSISAVDGVDRVSEIARMLGGEKLTSVVKRHAEELLQLSS